MQRRTAGGVLLPTPWKRARTCRYGFVSTDHDETTLDEIAGYALAFLGLAAQITFSARLPFPLSLVLVPFRLSEWGLRWSLSL